MVTMWWDDVVEHGVGQAGDERLGLAGVSRFKRLIVTPDLLVSPHGTAREGASCWTNADVWPNACANDIYVAQMSCRPSAGTLTIPHSWHRKGILSLG